VRIVLEREKVEDWCIFLRRTLRYQKNRSTKGKEVPSRNNQLVSTMSGGKRERSKSGDGLTSHERSPRTIMSQRKIKKETKGGYWVNSAEVRSQ